MNALAKLFRSRKTERHKPATTVEITFNGVADDAFARAFMEILRQGAIRIRRDDDEPPPVPA